MIGDRIWGKRLKFSLCGLVFLFGKLKIKLFDLEEFFLLLLKFYI